MISLRIKLTLVYIVMGMAGMFTALAFFYYAATTGIYEGAKKHAEVLSDEISYSLEILAAQDMAFPMQRLVEKSSILEGVSQIVIVNTDRQVLAHTNKQMVGQFFNSPLISEAITQNKKVSLTQDKRIIYVSPLDGPVYTKEFLNVTGALWIEIDVSPSILQVQKGFQIATLATSLILLLSYLFQYFTVKIVVIDRLHNMEKGIANAQQKGAEPFSAISIKKSFGSNDEINSLAHTYNYLLTSLMDSQERLETERDFALQVMESMKEGLTITNADGRFEYVNPAYAKFIGCTPQELMGKSPQEVSVSQDIDKHREAWELRKMGKSSSYEMRLNAKDNTEVHVLISSVPRFQNGAFAGSIAVVTDISQRALLEQMKSDFINRASHELRTPLTTAILMADLLEGGTDEEKKEFLTTLKQQLNRQRLLLNDLLVAGRIESKRYDVILSSLDVLPIIEEAIESLKLQADERQIKIKLEAEDAMPKVNTDRQALHQVLLNLLSNAIKFSHPNSEVSVNVRHDERSIIISVEDQGIGIPAEDLPYIATRFFRSKNATQNEIQGTGIGLYIVNEIMQNLGGHMDIHSVEEKGTIIKISIPYRSDGVDDSLA